MRSLLIMSVMLIGLMLFVGNALAASEGIIDRF